MRTNSGASDSRGWIRLMTKGRSKPSGPSPTARNTSAIPPLPIFSVSRYFIITNAPVRDSAVEHKRSSAIAKSL